MEEIINRAREKMNKAFEVLRTELAGIRTGRAHSGLVEGLKVEAYNTQMQLRELASINAPEPRLLTIAPWDSSLTESIVKAIRQSSLGFNPVVEGTLIRIPIPPLTEERRRDFLKIVGEKAESVRVAVRQIRREAIESLERLEEEGRMSEDDNRKAQERVQKIVDEINRQIEDVAKSKERDLLEL